MKDLIFKHSAKASFITADLLHDFTPREASGSRSKLILQQTVDQRWRRNKPVGSHAKLRYIIASRIRRVASPAVPVLGRPVDHRGFRVRVQYINLLFELFGQPYVVSI